jgi:hypothetical protein
MSDPNPTLPAPYCDVYRYNLDNFGIVTCWIGREGTWHAAFSCHVSMIYGMVPRLKKTAEEVEEKQAKQRTVLDLKGKKATDTAVPRPWPPTQGKVPVITEDE